jgi:hypothetical protein
MKIFSPLNALFAITLIIAIEKIILGFSGKETFGQIDLIWDLSAILLIGWWISADKKSNKHEYPYEFGPFIFVLWPITLPHYLYLTRGRKGIAMSFGFYFLLFFPSILDVMVRRISRLGFFQPRRRRRASQPVPGVFARPVFEPEARSLRPASWSSARWGEERRKFSRAPGCVSFGYFSLHKQRKVTCRGSATHKYASPKATQGHPTP